MFSSAYILQRTAQYNAKPARLVSMTHKVLGQSYAPFSLAKYQDQNKTMVLTNTAAQWDLTLPSEFLKE